MLSTQPGWTNIIIIWYVVFGRGAGRQVYNQVGPISRVFGFVCVGIDIVSIGIGRGARHLVHNHVGTMSSERGIVCIGIGINIVS